MLEDLDGDHAPAAAGAWRRWMRRQHGVCDLSRLWREEQFAGARDIGLAAGAGEQAVVADTMETFRQNVEQEAADDQG